LVDRAGAGSGAGQAGAAQPENRGACSAPGGEVAVAGMAVARQRPATANGVVFMLLEDELGQVNLIVPPPVYERFRPLVRGEPLLLARGRLERSGRNLNVLVRTLESLAPLAREVAGLAEIQAALPRAHHFGHR
jgi:DNA polymerase III alpha subunit